MWRRGFLSTVGNVPKNKTTTTKKKEGKESDEGKSRINTKGKVSSSNKGRKKTRPVPGGKKSLFSHTYKPGTKNVRLRDSSGQKGRSLQKD